MIIKKLAEGIRNQNWSTVTIEVLIVIFGVVIGIEVSNWNESRQFDALERELLVKLRDEVVVNNQRLQYRIAFTEQVIESGEHGLAFLKRGQPCTDDCQSVLVDFFLASHVWGGTPFQKIYFEMQRLGLPRSEDVKASVYDYYNVFTGLQVTIDMLPVFRKQIRNRIPSKDIKQLWLFCHHVRAGTVEVLDTSCVSSINRVDSGVIEYIARSPGIFDSLNGWVGQNEFTAQELPRQIKLGEVAIKAIEAELTGGS